MWKRKPAVPALSSASRRERVAKGNVRGSVIRAHLDWVREHRDRAEVIEFFETLPSSVRSIGDASWVPFQDLVRVDRAIVDRFGDGSVRFLEEVGAYSARQTLDAAYRYLSASSIHEFLRSSAQLRTELQDFGRAKYHIVHDTDGRMVHEKEVSFSPLHCATSVGFYRESIQLHGGGDVQVWESKCQCRGDVSCTFELLWD